MKPVETKKDFFVTFCTEGTNEDAMDLRKSLAQSVADEFALQRVENVSVLPHDSFTALRLFLRQEVPYRLTEHHGLSAADLTEGLVNDCINTLCDHSDVLFDYDKLDDFLRKTLSSLGATAPGNAE